MKPAMTQKFTSSINAMMLKIFASISVNVDIHFFAEIDISVIPSKYIRV
jgi:hypothetical protein